MNKHPEQEKGEIFRGNHNLSEVFPPKYLAVMNTLRLGYQAYDLHRNPLPVELYSPVFFHESESVLHETLCAAELKRIRMGLPA